MAGARYHAVVHAILALLAVVASDEAGPLAPDVSPSADPSPPRCLVVIDRHNHKTGGSTMRDIFAHQQAAGNCLYWGYGAASTYWERFVAFLENGGRPLEVPPGKLLRLCAELHFRVPYWSDSVPRLAAVRDRAAAAGTCRVVLVARVREPLSFYLSYWRWTIMGKQLSYLECMAQRGAGHAGRARMPKDVECPMQPSYKLPEGRFGFSFLEWVRKNPNLQSRLLLDAGASVCVEEPARLSPPPLRVGGPQLPCPRQAAAFGAAQRAELFARLDAHDVVGTLEDFDAHLLLLQRLSGWRADDLSYVQNTPRYRFLPPHFGGKALPTDHPLACANLSACVDAVRAVAPIDHELWQRYGVGFRARAAEALGGEEAMRRGLDELRAKRVALARVAAVLRNASAAAAAARRQSKRPARASGGSHHPPPEYSTDLRVRASRLQHCRPGKVAYGAQPPRAAPAAPPSLTTSAWRAELPEAQLAAADWAVSSARAGARAGEWAGGSTPCMPVPDEIVQLVQANFYVARPRAHHLPVMQLGTSSPAWVSGLAWWVAAHAELARVAGLPLVPAACAGADLAAPRRFSCPTPAERERLRAAEGAESES